MEEIWKDIVGYEGLYQVSNFGRVRSLDRFVKGSHNNLKPVKGKILNPEKTQFGYLQVSLSRKNLKHKRFKVHRLVADSFIANPFNLPQINHKDEDKMNNRVDNLEWCDSFYNQNYGTCGERKHKHLINHPQMSIAVEQLTVSGEHIAFYPSMKEAGRQTGIKQGSISKVCSGERSQAGCYKWKYV